MYQNLIHSGCPKTTGISILSCAGGETGVSIFDMYHADLRLSHPFQAGGRFDFS